MTKDQHRNTGTPIGATTMANGEVLTEIDFDAVATAAETEQQVALG